LTTPAGRVTLIEYYTSGARDGRDKSITREADAVTHTGPTTQFDYDLSVRGAPKATVTDPNGHDTDYEFDQLGRPVSVTDALGRAVSTSYTANSNVEHYSEP